MDELSAGPFLHDVLVAPLAYAVELAFSLFFDAIHDAGWAVVCTALVMCALSAPLYAVTGIAADEERRRWRSMAQWVGRIKGSSMGEDRSALLATYYRQRGYRTVTAFVPSLSLILQLPLFFAAREYLPTLTLLEGASFAGIADLGAPDGLFVMRGAVVNALPLVTFALACAYGAMHMRGLPWGGKLEAVLFAVAYAALLYQEPVGLSLFWAAWQACMIVFELSCALLNRWAPSISDLVANRLPGWVSKLRPQGGSPISVLLTGLFSCMLAAALTGLLIPSALVASSPTEFLDLTADGSPLDYLVHTGRVFSGLFIIWGSVLILFARPEARRAFALLLWVGAAVLLVDYLFFGQDLGIINTSLVFSEELAFSPEEVARNGLVLAALVAALLLVWRFAHPMVAPVTAIALVSVLGMGISNVTKVNEALASDGLEEGRTAELGVATSSTGEDDQGADSSEDLEEEAPRLASLSGKELFKPSGAPAELFTLSREGRNVIVLFLDRAIGSYVPYILAERPQLEEQFAGFTYYPNSISFGMWTMVGAPALAGGYEYTPLALNERADELLMDKHDEALKVLPKLFSEQGFSTTVIDPPLVHYVFSATNFSTFSDIEGVEVYRVAGAYAESVDEEYAALLERNRYRSFVLYSLMKALPVSVQPALYDEGAYHSTVVNHAANAKFLAEYSTLATLPALTAIDEGASDNYLFMQNEATHEPDLLQLPDYESQPYVDNRQYFDPSTYVVDGRTADMTGHYGFEHYCSAMAAFIQLGEWFDYLREQGVYDNTRIIVVSDHGYALGQFEDFLLSDYVDIEAVDCLLMVKDFGDEGPVVTSDAFMTTADVPTIALAGVVDDPVNPYTGNPISSDAKLEGPQTVYFTVTWNSNTHRKDTQFDFGDGFLYSVHDDIFDQDDWEILSEPTTSADWR